MQPIDRQLERDIVRYLDGELDEASRRALTERLRRDPAARGLLRDYSTVDRLACEALLAELDSPAGQVPAPVRPRAVLAVLQPALALAAAVVLAVVLWPAFQAGSEGPTRSPGPAGADQAALVGASPSRPMNVRLGPPAGFGGHRGQRQVERQVFGVIDQNGKLYVVEVDRERTQVHHAFQDF